MSELVFTEEHLSQIPDCYAVCPITAWGRRFYLFAADNCGKCCAIDAESRDMITIWEDPGGTMSIIPIPGNEGEFLISQRFLPGFAALGARIMRAKPKKYRSWSISTWLDLSYVHRFDILRRGGVYYFLACILSSTSNEKAEWTKPGYLAAAPLNGSFDPPQDLKIIADSMTRNHGYWQKNYGSFFGAFTSCDEGVFSVLPPETSGAAWTVTKILDQPVSDIALCDIDYDGEDEMAAILPFHGNSYVVYKKQEGLFREWYRYPDLMEFIHVVWGGSLGGRNVFLGGCRSINKELFALYWEDGKIIKQILDQGKGPANVTLERHGNTDSLLAANHSAGLASLYAFLNH
jgi:hypothetical protein